MDDSIGLSHEIIDTESCKVDEGEGQESGYKYSFFFLSMFTLLKQHKMIDIPKILGCLFWFLH